MQIMSIYCLEQKKSMMNPQKIYRKEKSLNISSSRMSQCYFIIFPRIAWNISMIM